MPQGNGFICFGGFEEGSRTNDVIKFTYNVEDFELVAEMLSGQDVIGVPSARSNATISINQSSTKIYMFGGQDNDSKRLNDLWEFDLINKAWSQIRFSWSAFKPLPRSGHTMSLFQDKLYIFGGIFELTKELNDLVIYDIKEKCFKVTMRSLQGKAPAKDQGHSPAATRFYESLVMPKRSNESGIQESASNSNFSPGVKSNQGLKFQNKRKAYVNPTALNRGKSAKSVFSSSQMSPVSSVPNKI